MIKELDLSITGTCGFLCPYCYHGNDGVHGDFSVIKSIIHNAIYYGGADNIVLGGGDPCTHPDIMRILEYAHDNKARTIVMSNRQCFPEYMYNVQDVLDEMDITIHGSCAEKHDAFNGMLGSYDMMLSNVSEFMKYRKRPEQSVGVFINLIPETVADLDLILVNIANELHLETGRDFIGIQRIVPGGKCAGDQFTDRFRLTSEMLNDALETLSDFSECMGIDVNYGVDPFPYCAVDSKFWPMLKRGGCNWGAIDDGALYVESDGGIYRCALSETKIGNFTQLDSLWKFRNFYENNPYLRAFRERLHLDEKCRSCDKLNVCSGACVCSTDSGIESSYCNRDTSCPNVGHDYLRK